MSLWQRCFPAPVLSAALLVLWVLLARSTSAGHFVLGFAIAVVVPILTSKLIPQEMRIARPRLAIRYSVRVLGEVVLSNLAVGRGVLDGQPQRPSAGFVSIPLDLRDPVGLAVLAMVTTIVPGTVWSELAADRSKLLLHVWDIGEEHEFVSRFKTRYEQPLREIFE